MNPTYNAQAVEKYFEQHNKDIQNFVNQKSCYTRLLVVKDTTGKERIACRTLRWQERVLATLKLGKVALFFGYGNANFHDVVKKCVELELYDKRLGQNVQNFNNKKILKISAKYIRIFNLEETPFFNACKTNNIYKAQQSLTHGVDIDRKNSQGQTALHIACLHGNKDIVNFLLENKCDVNAQDNTGCTALFIAGTNSEVVKLLLKNKANPAITNNLGSNVLQYPLETKSYNAFVCLLENDVSIDLLGTTLNKATVELLIFSNNTTVIRALQQHGAKLEEMHTLHDVCHMNLIGIAKVLLENGYDAHSLNNENKTALDVAKESIFVEKPLIELLEKYTKK